VASRCLLGCKSCKLGGAKAATSRSRRVHDAAQRQPQVVGQAGNVAAAAAAGTAAPRLAAAVVLHTAAPSMLS
jgi:hypothetical protein